MTAAQFTTIRAALACTTLLGASLVAGPVDATSAPAAARGGNPTGTAAGSRPNGAGNLHVSLSLTADGRVRVGWQRPAPPQKLENFVVKVGMNRLLDNKVTRYHVSRKAQSLVVPQAFGAVADSGNFTFVKVTVHRKNGKHGSSPTKWIEAPIANTCTAAADDRVKVGTFNVRNWQAEERKGNHTYPWDVRGPHVVGQIIRSDVHAIAIQEASGPEHAGFGPREQDEWLLHELNARDSAGEWADALPDDLYKNPGGKPGLKGTRVFYDRTQFRLLDRGLYRMHVHGLPADSLMPWALLQSTTGPSAPFVLTSNHLDQGEDRTSWDFRYQQVTQMVANVQALHARFGTQVVVAGDLNETANTNPYNQAHKRLIEAGLFDAFATTNLVNGEYSTTNGLDFPVRPTPNRRDYILTYGSVRGSCKYKNVSYVHASGVASDHFMQWATLPLPAY
jgi:endonuclease/exonuclease/phosphatase family metal-dependent hydrolase